MKKHLIYTFSLVSTLLFTNACQESFDEQFQIGTGTTSTISTSGISGGLRKSNNTVIIPVSIKLDKPASKAFEVKIIVNQDSLDKLVDAGQLNNLVPIQSNHITVPNVAQVAYGSDSAQFNIEITRTILESNFNKDVVFGYSIDEPGKGNLINNGKNFQLISFNTGQILEMSDIHYIYMTNGAAGIINARNRLNYTSTSSGLTVPIGLSLASFPGNPFRVNIRTNIDTIADLVAAGTLPENTIALQPDQYTLNQTVSFGSNISQADLNLFVNWTVINQYPDKQLAVFVEANSSNLHVIDTTKNYTVVLIDAQSVMERDITNDGVFSVNIDNGGGADGNEGSKKLVDNSITTKFLISDFGGTLWAKIAYTSPQNVVAYTLTSGNDAKDRDPSAWILEGSNDGTTWTAIDTRVNMDLGERRQTNRYTIAFPRPFNQYRINFTANRLGSLFQISEWRLISAQ